MRRPFALLLILLSSLLASCDPRSGSEEFAPPQIVDVSASVVKTRATLSCTLTSSRADRCGFLVGLDEDNLEEYESEMGDRGFSLPISNLKSGQHYYFQAFLQAGKSVILSDIMSFYVESLYPTEYDNIPENELWYESNSREAISFEDSAFSSIVSDHVFSDGKGVVRFQKPLTVIRSEAFQECSSLTAVVLPPALRELEYSAFRECLNHKSVWIADGLERVGDTVFHNCQKLSFVRLPLTLKSLEKDSFSHCFGLEEIDLPDGLMFLEQSAFLNCTSLKSIDIPSSVQGIGFRAFDNDSSLVRVIVRAVNPPAGNELMFHGTGDCPIYVPKGSEDAYKEAPYWREYSSRILPIEGNINE